MKVQHTKAIVQHVFSLIDDEGEVIRELIPEPVTVFGKDWPDYSSAQFPKDMRGFEQEMIAAEAAPANGEAATVRERPRAR